MALASWTIARMAKKKQDQIPVREPASSLWKQQQSQLITEVINVITDSSKFWAMTSIERFEAVGKALFIIGFSAAHSNLTPEELGMVEKAKAAAAGKSNV